MRTKVHKWFWIWDFDKEEKWLNEMASKGLTLTSIGYCTYVFEDTLPGEYSIKLEMLKDVPSKPESIKYIQFVEETGAEYLGSMLRWVYFRKKKEYGEFELYSDYPARIKHLTMIFNFLLIMSLVNLANGLNNLILGLTNQFIVNTILGIMVLLLSLVFLIGAYKLWKKRDILKKEAQLFE